MGGNEMSSQKRKEAVRETFAFSRGKFESDGNQGSDLRAQTTSACVQWRASSAKHLPCAMMPRPARMSGHGGRSPFITRRIAAASCVLHARGVSFGVIAKTLAKDARHNAIREHGLIASNDFMGAPWGESSDSPLPSRRYFLHSHGAARPVGRADGFDSLLLGATAMTLHEAEGAPSRAYPLGVSSLRAFFSRVSCGNIRLPRRMTGCRLGGLLKRRRITAAPRLYARGFSFGAIPCTGSNAPARGIRYPGRIAPTDFVMGTPGGKPSGLPFPTLRSANLPGVALLLAEERGKDNSNVGNSAMNKHEAVNAPARALNLGLCKVLNLINCFTGKAGYVQPLGSYPATGPGMRLPSIWKVNPELLELARVEANRAAASMEVRHA